MDVSGCNFCCVLQRKLSELLGSRGRAALRFKSASATGLDKLDQKFGLTASHRATTHSERYYVAMPTSATTNARFFVNK